jgi:hypothetical protein
MRFDPGLKQEVVRFMMSKTCDVEQLPCVHVFCILNSSCDFMQPAVVMFVT